jgi:hypothetical protein
VSVLLTLVATLIVGRAVPVYCQHPPGIVWTDGVAGYALWPPDEVYLRRCRRTLALRPSDVTVFAHELIHVEHHHWPHWKVYRWAAWYGRTVVAPAIRRIQRRNYERLHRGR